MNAHTNHIPYSDLKYSNIKYSKKTLIFFRLRRANDFLKGWNTGSESDIVRCDCDWVDVDVVIAIIFT